MYLGGNEIVKMYLGSNEIQKKYLGSNLIYELLSLTIMHNLIGENGNMLDTDGNLIPDGFVASNMTGVSVVDNVATFIATAQNGYARYRNFIVGHEYFACALVKATSSNVKFVMGTSSAHSGGGEFELLGVKYTATSIYGIAAVQDVSADSWANISVANFVFADLTVDFADKGKTIPTVKELLAALEYRISVNGFEIDIPYEVPAANLLSYITPWTVPYIERNELNTGLTDDTILTTVVKEDVYGMSLTEGGTIENVDLEGYISIPSTIISGTIRNCRIKPRSTDSYGIQGFDGQTRLSDGIVIEDCEIDMVNCGGSSGIIVGGATIQRCHIHHCPGDGIKPLDDTVIQDNFIHTMGYGNPLAHADGIQISGNSNIIIRRNTIDMPTNEENTVSTSCVMIKADSNNIDNIDIEFNYFNGGGFTNYIALNSSLTYACTNINYSNNLYGRDYDFGIFIASELVRPYTWFNNGWKDSGVLIVDPNI